MNNSNDLSGRSTSYRLNNPFSVALVSDFAEENWTSMNVVSDMLYQQVRTMFGNVTLLRPEMRYRFSSLANDSSKSNLRNMDRLLNRFFDYPCWMHQRSRKFELFHIIDHSYSQLVHALPAERTVVTCHDLDTFRCLLEPNRELRSWPFRRMARWILDGLLKCARVVCVSRTVREELLSFQLLPPNQVSVIPNGVDADFSHAADELADFEADCLLPPESGPYLLHVGSTIQRKRIDTLLQITADVRKHFPVTLVRVGGKFTDSQDQLIQRLGIRSAIRVLPFLTRPVLAAVYRRSTLALLPSSQEGFGLPLVEAMACGCPVVASDIPVLREVGAEAPVFCPVDDISAWSSTLIGLLTETVNDPNTWEKRKLLSIQRAGEFSWAQSAASYLDLYKQVLHLT